MPRGIDEVDEVALPIGVSVNHRDCLRFDGYTSLSLDFQLIEKLRGR